MRVGFLETLKKLSLILVIGLIYLYLNSPSTRKHVLNRVMDANHDISIFERIITEEKERIREENVKYIYYINNIHAGTWELVFGYGRQPFAKCEFKNCFLTSDNTKPIPLHKFSAAIIHARDSCGSEDLKRVLYSRSIIKGQFIHYIMESPNYDCAFSFESYNEVFNWTMGYHPNADIPSMYGGVYRVQKKQPIPDLTNIMRMKSKLAFWLVSHIGSVGRRDEYVQMLQKHMTVDIYGEHGPNYCPDSPNPLRIDCKKYYASKYKFFFAFENSLCRNYVSNKFFHALRLPMVPVVYGKTNYTAIAPPHSFIDVRDFNSPKALADYLLYLDKNDTAYLEYFKWKLDGHYKVTRFDQEAQKSLCLLCDKLNNDKPKRAHTAAEMNKYWRGTKEDPMCSTAEEIIPGLKKN